MNLFWEHNEPSPLLSALARIVYGQPDGPPYPLMGPPSSVPVQYVDPMGPPYVPPPPSFFASNRADSERGGMSGPPMPAYPFGPPSDLAPMGPFASEQSPQMMFGGRAPGAPPHRTMRSQPAHQSVADFSPPLQPQAQAQVNGMLGEQPDFSLEAMLRDPSIQALLQPTPFPQMAQPPDRAMLQPHGFLESLAQSAPGILEGLGNAHPRNFGEGLLSGLVGGVTSGLARRGQETLGARQSTYQQQGDAATARNKMLADAWNDNEKSRLQSFHQALVKGYEERNKQANAADLIPTPQGLIDVYKPAGVTLPAKITEKQHDALAKLRPYPGGPYVMVPGIGPVASEKVYAEQEAYKRAMLGNQNGRTQPLPTGAVPVIAESILSGQSKLSDYQQRDRDEIVTYMANTNQRILPQKARDTIAQLKAARRIVGQLKDLSLGPEVNGVRHGGINTAGPGVGRFGQGAQRATGAFLQSDRNATLYQKAKRAFGAALARASGERGVLTDADVARGISLVAGLSDARDIATGQWDELGDFLNAMEQGAIDAYSTKQDAQRNGVPPAARDSMQTVPAPPSAVPTFRGGKLVKQ